MLKEAAWRVDGVTSGSDLPPVGRSLFDYLVTDKEGGNGRYDVPFPFTVLVQKIERQIESGAGGATPARGSPLKSVLIPINRSLQRNAAAGVFFRYPRVVLGVDTESAFQADRDNLYLKDRLFLGYQEKSGVIEVISYNEAAGRFEFQIVRDYREGGQKEVIYANRALCTTCHQNEGPIFSRPLWDETNANPKIASRLKAEGRTFYQMPIHQGVDIPNALDEATDRANLLSVYQALWQEGCEVPASPDESISCRADLTRLLLQYRLGSPKDLRKKRPEIATFSARFIKQLSEKWPGGFFIPNPDIPNRNPFDFLEPENQDQKTPASFFEPSVLRDPIAHWPTSNKQEIVDRAIAGLAGFLAREDIERLDAALFKHRANSEDKISQYTADCLFSPRWQKTAIDRLLFQCNRSDRTDGFSMDGVIYFNSGGMAGTLDHLWFKDGNILTDIAVTGGAAGAVVSDRQKFIGHLGLAQKTAPIHARLADGRAIAEISFEMERGKERGTATAKVKDDFSVVQQAIDQITKENRLGRSDLFAKKPFRRAAVMNALFEKLDVTNPIGCCLDDTKMPAAVSASEHNNKKGEGERQRQPGPMAAFYQYCGACHHEQDPFPPNFLHGSEEQVQANLSQCAERIFFRLEMGQRPLDQRAHTPMPPEIALKRRNFSPKQWADHPDLKVMKQYVTNLLKSSGRPVFESEKLVLQEYDSLPDCLAPV
ncbi:MAG: hypothetical protein AAB300_04170 [Nitrospirota bacterium]